MKTKYILLTILCSFLLISCGRQELIESGSVSTDSAFISTGRFTESVVGVDSDLTGYYFLDAAFVSDRFYYVFQSNVISDSIIISFDSKGSNYSASNFVLPFYINNPYDSSYFDFTGYEGLNCYYYDPCFVDDSIEGYCYISGYKYSDDVQEEYFNQYFKIDWNLDGSVKTVETVDLDPDSVYGVVSHDYISCDNNGNMFSITDSGLVRYSGEGKYVDTYFDYINSSYSGSFKEIVYGDENLFSAFTVSEDNNSSISLFSRDESSVNSTTPISLYCSSMNDDLRQTIISFNNNSKDYKIGVRNYSDIYRDYNEVSYVDSFESDVALYNLKEDVLSGDVPDLIYQTSGCDFVFVNGLSASGIILNLKDMMKTDKDIKGNKYLTNIYDLFDDDNVYALIPSFTFDTCVASGTNGQITRNWSLDEFVNYKSQFENDMIVIDSYSSNEFILRALAFNGDSWINETSGNAVFGDDFKTYLEIASKLPASYDDFTEKSMAGEIPVDIHVFYTPIGNLSKDYLLSWRRVYADPFNVGFPTNTGSDRVIHPSGALMLCSDRAASKGCWEFAKTLLSTEYQDGLTDSIPVLESSYENWKSNVSYDGIDMSYLMLNVDGQLCTAPLLTNERVELLSTSITSCENYYFVNPEIEEIVLRNASLYFDGSISADDAASNTEVEVEEYLQSLIKAS